MRFTITRVPLRHMALMPSYATPRDAAADAYCRRSPIYDDFRFDAAERRHFHN